MKFKSLILSVALAAGVFAANAQSSVVEYESAPYWFAGIKGGVQAVPTNYSFTSLLSPAFGVQIGRQFTPQLGIRLDVQGMTSKTAFRSADATDGFKYLTGDVDLLFNITNMFMKRPHLVDVSLVLGAGLNYSWDAESAGNYPFVDRSIIAHENLWSHNLRGGLLFDFNLNCNWVVNVEFDANNLNEEFNSKWNGATDWQLTAMAGVAYRWGHKAARVVRTEPEPVVEKSCETCGKVLSQCQYNGKHPKCQTCGKYIDQCQYNGNHPVEKPVVYTKPEEIHIEVFFDLDKSVIRSSEDAKLRGLSDFIQKYQVGTVVVKAYADRETGNPEYNQGLSERRAATIVNELTKTYGIPADRIESNAYGDKVQPYSENAMNRVVIIDVKEASK